MGVLTAYLSPPEWEYPPPPRGSSYNRAYAKTPIGFAMHPPQKLQNRRVCLILKVLITMFNTPKPPINVEYSYF